MSFTPQVITGTSADGDYVYYNATVVNNTVQTDIRSQDPELVFQDTRQNAIIKDSSKYVMSVDGFKLDGPQKNFPLWIPQIQPGVKLSKQLEVTATSSVGGIVTYTVADTTGLVAGDLVLVTGAVPTASYNITTASPILNVTPTSFDVAAGGVGPSSTALAVFPFIAGTQDDVDVTIYTVTFGIYTQNLTSGAPDPTTGVQSGTWVQATVPISWIPENVSTRDAPVPTSSTPRQQETNYYYGYTYDHFVYLLNNALTTAWRDVMFRAAQGPPGLAYGTKCPFFEFNPETGLFSLCQDAQTSWLPYGTLERTVTEVYDQFVGISDAMAPFTPFGPSTATGYLPGEFSYVGMNANLEGLLSNFQTVYYGRDNATLVDGAAGIVAQGYSLTLTTSEVLAPDNQPFSALADVLLPDFVFNVQPLPTRPNSVFILGPPYKDPTNAVCPVYVRDTQNYKSTGSLWSPIASIVLVTGTLPVRFEFNAAPVDLGTGNVGGTTASTGAAQRVLLEVALDELTADGWRGALNYKPQIPLFSALDPVHDGINSLDVRVCWRSRLTNSLIPVKMYNSSSFNLRLRFVKKS